MSAEAHRLSTSVKQSRISFTAIAGKTYRIAVDGASNAVGSVILTWTWSQVPTGSG